MRLVGPWRCRRGMGRVKALPSWRGPGSVREPRTAPIGRRQRLSLYRPTTGHRLFWTVPERASITPAFSPMALHPRAGAQVAQLVEHVTENHGVGGSIPPLGTKITQIN
jgi:hypothetical protein